MTLSASGSDLMRTGAESWRRPSSTPRTSPVSSRWKRADSSVRASARKEDPRFLTGRGRYTDDVVLPGMLHVAFVRSPHARAGDHRVDTTEAAAHARGRRGATPSTISRRAADEAALNAGPLGSRPLAHGVVCFVGDPVVLVVAESRALAEDACELVERRVRATARGRSTCGSRSTTTTSWCTKSSSPTSPAPPRHPTTPSSARRSRPPPHVVTETIRQHRYIAVPMETRGAVASWDPGRGDMTIWISSQGAHGARDHFARHPRPSRREGARHRARRRRRVRPEDQRRAARRPRWRSRRACSAVR